MIKKELHLAADKQQEATNGRLSSFVDISRSKIQLLKLNEVFKAVEFLSWKFPHSSIDKTWSERVNEVFKNDEFAKAISETSCKCSVSDNQVVLVPETLFSGSEKEKHFDFLFNDNQDSEVLTQKLSNTDAVGLFAFPKTLKDVLTEPISSSFITWVDSILGTNSGIKSYLIIDEKQLSLTIIKEGKLLFSNWFQYSKPDDVLYFLMASLESLNILHSEIELILGGEIEKGDETFTALSRFISKISFLKRPKNLKYSYSFSQLAEHRFPSIFASACA